MHRRSPAFPFEPCLAAGLFLFSVVRAAPFPRAFGSILSAIGARARGSAAMPLIRYQPARHAAIAARRARPRTCGCTGGMDRHAKRAARNSRRHCRGMPAAGSRNLPARIRSPGQLYACRGFFMPRIAGGLGGTRHCCQCRQGTKQGKPAATFRQPSPRT
jgi:hypothetical protein